PGPGFPPGDIATMTVSMSSRGVRPVSCRKRCASPSVEISSMAEKIFAPSGLLRSSFQRKTPTVAAPDGTSASASSARRTACALEERAKGSAPARARRDAKRRRFESMSEVLSRKEPRREEERGGAEEGRRTEDAEMIEHGETLGGFRAGDEHDRGLAEL